MKIDKEYFSLEEIRERWRVPDRDIAYLAETGQLNVSVRVYGIAIEICSMEEDADGIWFRLPHTRTRFHGLLDLHAQDAFRMFRNGGALLSHFLAPDGDHASVLHDAEAIDVRMGDLVVRREERDRYEEKSGFSAGHATVAAAFTASPDYRKVWLGDEILSLGPIQAEVIRALHAAQLADDPWQSGKTVLTAVGSKSLRMADVFKSKPRWRQLIESNQRGFYRLAVSLAAN